MGRHAHHLGKARLPIGLPLSRMFPLVISPTIGNMQVHCILIDGGSSFSIITVNTLDIMQMPRSKIDLVSKSFHGITPGMAHKPLGLTTMPVIFEEGDNFHHE